MKIKSSLLPVQYSILDGSPLQEPIHETLAMYERGEDITYSPFIQSGQWRHHISTDKTLASGLKRQEALVALYQSIKSQGYNGSEILVWFDDEGKVHVYDGFHRVIIMNYLGMNEDVNASTDWTEPPALRFTGRDFPIDQILLNEPPLGKWLYQPIGHPKVKGWKVARPDSEQRLQYILKNLSGETVLDIGCAEGYFSRGIAREGYKVTGIDQGLGLVAAARYLTTLEGLDITYQIGDWASVKGKFDNVLMLSVTHNEMKIMGIENALEKLKLLKGRARNLFLEVPNNTREKQWMVTGFPDYDFHASIGSIAKMLGMRVVGSHQSERTTYHLSVENLILEPDINGFPMYLFSDEQYITYMAKTGIYEPKTVEFIRENIRPGQVFVDVGANVGLFTVLASKLGAKVYAFEPSSECFEVLQRNLKLNDCRNVEAFKIGLSNSSGRTKLYKPNPKSYGQQYLEEVVKAQSKLDYEQYDTSDLLQSDHYEEIGLKRMDEVLDEAPDMVKVDVEGAERLVLEGMGELLAQTKTVILEDLDQSVHPWLVEKGFRPTMINYERRNCIVQRVAERPMALHILGVPYTKTRKDYTMCPFTQLTYNMVKMMTDLGYLVYHYGAEGSVVPCEHIDVVSDELQQQTYGGHDSLHKYWSFKRDDVVFKTFAENAIKEINKRKQPKDMILTVNGRTDKGIADATGLMPVEYAIGYEGVFSQYKVFASYAWMHYIYGRTKTENGNWYDCVIPHYVDENDFPFTPEKEDYFVYLGRLVPRKGPHIAAQVCERLGVKLKVAGQGDLYEGLDKPCVERIDAGTLESKVELLSKAKGVFCPTMYIEPFNMVVIEALMCGTPVIASDWGAFSETLPAHVGFRCRTFAEFLFAAENVKMIQPEDCRQWAVDNFSLPVVAQKYRRYFDRLQDLYRKGWYEER